MATRASRTAVLLLVALLSAAALLPPPVQAGWVKVLDNKPYHGASEPSPYTPLVKGITFHMTRAVWRSGYVTCNRGYSGDSRPWNACNPSHGDVYSFELRLDGTFIADAPAWGVLPSNCDKPSSLRGDIYCATPDKFIGSTATFQPTWDEPSKGVSLSDNGGSLYIDLYVFQADWVSILTPFSNWGKHDDGASSGPSNWRVESGELRQTSNIHSGSRMGTSARGTYLYYKPALGLSDYLFKAEMKNSDNDGIGLCFRWQDSSNFYRYQRDLSTKSMVMDYRNSGSNGRITSNSGDYYTQHSYETHTLVSRGSYHKVFINGGISTNFKDGKNAKGAFGFWLWASSNVYVRNIKYIDLAATTCGAGSYSSGGSCTNCPAGKYRGAGDPDGACIDCAPGKYNGAAGASSCSTSCPKKNYCEAGSSSPVLCPAGTYGSSVGLGDKGCTGDCDKGYYCLAGSESKTSTACPAGRFGSTEGLKDNACSGACFPGHYCPAGSTNPSPAECSAGYWGGSDQSVHTCEGKCRAGYYCPSGSTKPDQTPCGGAKFYCPEGASTPSVATEGQYTHTGSEDTRQAVALCEKGHYCPGDGKQHPCPAGTYGKVRGLKNAACSGKCSNGYFCEAGSEEKDLVDCGTGSCAGQPAACFCPEGTPERRLVRDGYYTLGSTPSRRHSEAVCPAGFVCNGGDKSSSASWVNCPGGATTMSADEEASGAFGTALNAAMDSTPAYAVTKVLRGAGCGSAPPVSIGASNGELRFTTGNVNYETCPEFLVTVSATSATSTIYCDITVGVNNVNEPPSFTNCGSARSVVEGSPINMAVSPPVVASDIDIGQELSYSIIGGTGASFFKIGGCSGQIQVADDGLRHNDHTSLGLTIQVKDDGVPAITRTCGITIAVENRNDPPVSSDAVMRIEENSAKGATVGTLTATDADGDTLTWTLVSSGTSVPFAVASDGTVTVSVAKLDYENTRSYFMKTSVTDGASVSVSDLVIHLDDANDPPTLADVSYIVDENKATGTPVGGLITARDQDVGDTMTYSLSGADAAAFQIVGSSGQLQVKSVPDFETKSSYSFQVVATDSAGATATANVLVTIANVPEAVSVANQARTVPEDAVVGSKSAALVATDPDGVGVQVWSIESGNDGGVWSMGVYSGELTVSGALDFETKPSYSLGVKVTDSGGLSDTATLTVTISDRPDAPRVPTGQTRSVAENSAAGTQLPPAVVAEEDDAGDSVTFAIVAGNDGGAFSIGASTGVVEVADQSRLDYEARESFSLTVQATDSTSLVAQGVLVVQVADVNEPPVFADGGSAARSVAEQTSKADVGSPVVANDPELSAISYSLASNPSGFYEVVAATGQIRVRSDRTLPATGGSTLSHSLVVRATDNRGASSTLAVDVTVVDKNDPPVYADASRSVAENSAAGTTVGSPHTATDADAGDTLLYSIKEGNNAGLFAINPSTGQVSVASAGIDYETANTYVLTLVARDQREPGSLSASCKLTINVVDVNEGPMAAPKVLRIDENSAAGAAVGTYSATDPDGDTLTYTLSDDSNVFVIEASTGKVTVAKPKLNYETKDLYLVTITAKDPSGLTDDASVSIYVDDANDDPTFLALPQLSVREDAAVRSKVGSAVAATDEDGDALTYSIVGGNDALHFGIDTKGQIEVNKALDFETQATYSLQVRVDDARGTPATASVVVRVSDVNESPVVTAQSVSVKETAAMNLAVATMSATDPDAGDIVSFRIMQGNVGDVFSISPSSGLVSVAGALDAETVSTYALIVAAIDKLGATSQATLTVTVQDVNEEPSLPTGLQRACAENSPIGTPVGLPLPVLDQDVGDSHTFSITGGNVGGFFAFADKQLVVAKEGVDFESTPTFTLSISVADSGGLSASGTVTIQVTDVNEHPSLAGATLSVAENSVVNTEIGAPLSASDPDHGQLLIFSIVSGSDKFKINPCSGQLAVARDNALNFEATASYTLKVRVTDDGQSKLSAEADVIVNLENVNEAPIVPSVAFYVDENSAVNTAVGTVTFGDPDLGHTTTVHSFAIAEGNAGGAFTIGATTGQITVASPVLDYEGPHAVYTLRVSVTDNDVPSLTTLATITVNVRDVNEAPLVATQARSVPELSAVDTLVGDKLVASDPDGTDQQLTWALATTGTPFAVTAAGNLVVATATLDHESTSKYTLTLQVTDNGEPARTSEATVTVTVTDVNEAPVLADAARDVAENSPVGSAVGAPLVATDADDGQSLTYTVSAQSSPGVFRIDAISGQLEVANTAAIDYEGGKQDFTVTVQVTDSGTSKLSDSAVVSIKVTDVNEAPVVARSQVLSVPEDADPSYVLGNVAVSDQDADDTISYSIVSGAMGVFVINGATGQLSLANDGQVDYEVKAVYELVVKAVDVAGAADSATVRVDVVDTNDRPLFTSSVFPMSVAENAAQGLGIAKAFATDQDKADVGRLVWTLETASDIFTMDASSGELKVKQAGLMSHATQPSITLTVSVEDGVGARDTATIELSVVDANDPPSILNAAAARSVPENADSGAAVGAALSGSDPEDNTLTWTLGAGNDAGIFAINGASGQITVANAGKLDFESATSHTLTVVCTDDGAGNLQTSASVLIGVVNVNERPTVQAGHFEVPENSVTGTFVGTVVAADVDSGDTANLRFEIVSSTPAAVFAISPSTGVITVATPSLNAEVVRSYTVTVAVTDPAGLRASAASTIAVADINDAPVMGDQTRSVDENVPSGTVVGTALHFRDDDLASGQQGVSFAIVAGNVGDAFSVDTRGQLFVAQAVDFETTATYVLTVRISDNGSPSLSDQASITVNVKDVNEVPRFASSSYTRSIAEDAAAATKVGAVVTAQDSDAGQGLVYSISGEAREFAVDSATGQITLRAGITLNYETRSLYQLTLVATDVDPAKRAPLALSGTTSIDILVTDVNEPPALVLPEQGFSIRELGGPGARVTGVVGAADVDAADDGQLRFSVNPLVGDGATTFALDAVTGELTVASGVAALDFETKTQYTLGVVVSDSGGLQDSATIVVRVLDVNEPPVIQDATRSIDEGSSKGALVGVPLPATDPDQGQALSFAITGGDPEAMRVFSLNPCSGLVTVKVADLDHERQDVYIIEVTVTDDGVDPASLSATATLTVNVADLNEAPKLLSGERAVTENSALGAVVGDAITATDEDRPMDVLTFSIESGNDKGLFDIDGTSGQVKLAGAVDYEQQHSYSIVVRVEDEHGLFSDATYLLRVIDINESPQLVAPACDIPENSPAGTVVCNLEATDPDSHTRGGDRQALSYQIFAGNGDNRFAMTVDSTANVGTLTVGAVAGLNFEATTSYELTIRVTDDGIVNNQLGASLFVDTTVMVRVLDVNEAPSIAPQTRNVNEDAALRTPIGLPLVALDPDTPWQDFLHFSLVGGDAGSFNISDDGQLSTSAALDYETKARYVVVVRVTDEGYSNELVDETEVVIQVGDVQEAPVMATGVQLTVPENSAADTPVLGVTVDDAVVAHDVDAADAGELRYSLSGDLFDIDPDTGAVSVAVGAALDFESQREYSVVATVVDSSGKVDSAAVTILISDVNEQPVITLPQTFGLREGAANGFVIDTVRATDPDVGDSLSWQVLDGEDGAFGTFGIQSSGQLFVADASSAALVHSDTGSNLVPVSVQVTDSAGASDTATVHVEVVDNNFAPVMTDATFALDEAVPPNNMHGTVVGTVRATDQDATQTHSYSITLVQPPTAAPMFAIRAVEPDSGEIYVADTSALQEYMLDHERFPTVQLTVTATDSGVGSLTDASQVVITVNDLPEAPTVNRPDGGVVYVDEGVEVGTAVGAALQANDQDAGQANPAFSIAFADPAAEAAAGAGALPFVIGATSGQITVDGALDFETRTKYPVVVTVTDASGLTDSTSFDIAVNNINELPVAQVAAFSIAEGARIDEFVGQVIASDVDRGVLSYEFAPPAGKDITDPDVAEALQTFTIEPLSGTVRVATASLDYERRTSYSLQVVVSDDGPGDILSVKTPLTITIVDVNDLEFTRITATVASDGSVLDSDLEEVLLTTGGSESITFHGHDMGWVVPPPGDNTVVSATYTSGLGGGVTYTATNCRVSTPNTAITCTTAPGVGADLVWTLTVGPWSFTAPAGLRTRYRQPTVTSILDAGALSTLGNEPITLRGRDFGPVGTTIGSLAYWSSSRPHVLYGAKECQVTFGHLELTCKSVPGVGANLHFKLTIAQQSSAVAPLGGLLMDQPMSYAQPEITSMQLLADDGVSLLPLPQAGEALRVQTTGSQVLIVTGSNFGPASGHTVRGGLGVAGDARRYSSPNCRVRAHSTELACDVPSGVGTELAVWVEVGGIASDLSSSLVSYKVPSITAVSGPGASDADTSGGQGVFLNGVSFGPTGDLHSQVIARYGPPAAAPESWQQAADCSVSESNARILCHTTPGVGFGHSWQVRVGGQWSEAYAANTGYARPVLISYSGAGSDLASTVGGDTVIIEGRQFGPEGAANIDRVLYAQPDDLATQVDVTASCTVSTAHFFLTCTTGPGAGKELTWSVSIGGQESGAPTTNYDAPTITSLSGAAVAGDGAASDGNQELVVHGKNFGPPADEASGRPSFLQRFTYGVSGSEYDATAHCVVESHTELRCKTTAGVGRDLQLVVVVQNQPSYLSTVRLAYAAPRVTALSRSSGSTRGGFQVAITGTNFGLASTAKFRGAASTAPLSSLAVLFGDTTLPDSAVTGHELLGADATTGASVHRLVVDIPEDVLPQGQEWPLVIVVRDLASGAEQASPLEDAVFKYDNPHIDAVFKLLGDRLVVEGDSFGIGGVLRIHDADPDRGVTEISHLDATAWSHTSVEVTYSGDAGTVTVVRGEQVSNEGTFERIAPTIGALQGAISGAFPTKGGTELVIEGQNLGEPDKLHLLNVTVETYNNEGTLEERQCEITEFIMPAEEGGAQTVKCAIPAGQGEEQKVTMYVGGNPSTGSAGDAVTLSYEQPSITGVELRTSSGEPAPAQWPTDGLDESGAKHKLRVTGSNFGTSRQLMVLWRCANSGGVTDACITAAKGQIDFCASRAFVLGQPLPEASCLADASLGTEVRHVQTMQGCVYDALSHASAECDAPEGEGEGLFLTLSLGVRDGRYLHDVPPADSSSGGRRAAAAGAISATFAPPQVTSTTTHGSTQGGYTFVVTGKNLGRPETEITITVGGFACTDLTHTHTSASCKLAEGQGKGLLVDIVVVGLANTGSPSYFSYDAPLVTAISTTSADSSALDSSGTVIVATISGSNFGLSGTVWLTAPATSPAVQGSRSFKATVKVWSHTGVEVELPAGQGKNLIPTVRVGPDAHPSQQISTTSSASIVFSYNPPDISCQPGATPATEPGCALAKHPSWVEAGMPRYSDPETLLPTRGYYNMTLRGVSMGIAEGVVVLEHHMDGFGGVCAGAQGEWSSTCELQASAHENHDAVVFEMPPGIGAGFTIKVRVAGQTSAAIRASYDKPVISFVRPNEASALGAVVKLDGYNFGGVNTGPSVQIHGLNCSEASLVAGEIRGGVRTAANVRCVAQTDVVGYKNLTVAIAGQTVHYHLATGMLAFFCPNGYYGQLQEVCLGCPRGAHCAGQLAEPSAQEGWWLQNATGEQCPEQRRPPASTRENCPQLVPCEPRWACNASNVCNLGYTGDRCALCSGGYYRRAGECEECPNNPLVLVLGFVVGAIVLSVCGYFLNKNHVNLAFASIGVDYFQVLAIFANSRVEWPAYIKSLFHILSVFNFNLELTAPECSIPEVTYTLKWSFVMLLPVGATALFLVMHCIQYVRKRCIMQRRRKVHSHVSLLVSIVLVMFYFLYLYLTRTTLDVFNCSPTDPPDGHEYLEVVFERCDKPGGIHRTLLPFAIITLAVYVFGYPISILVLLYRNRFKIMEDQLLRAKDTGRTRLTNPNQYDFRKRYHRLYYHFRPHKWFWVTIIIGRKFFIAFTALMFNKNPAFQLSIALLVLFIAYALQVRFRPFMSMSERAEVLRDHVRHAVEQPLGADARLAATLAKVKSMDRRRGNKAVGIGGPAASVAGQAVNYFWSYNTVEATLLFSATLVALAGVMFQSGRFESEYYTEQRDFIATVVILVVVLSMLYFATVALSEIYVTIRKPKRKAKKGGKGGKRSAAESTMSVMGGPGGDGIAMTPMGGASSSDSHNVNPMFLAMQRAGASKGGMNPALEKHAEAAAENALASTRPPDAASWQVIQANSRRLRQQLDAMNDAYARLKREHQSLQTRVDNSHQAGRAGAGGGARVVTKTSFGQRQAPDSSGVTSPTGRSGRRSVLNASRGRGRGRGRRGRVGAGTGAGAGAAAPPPPPPSTE